MFISPSLTSVKVLIIASGILATIPAKIRSDMPFPMPWSDITSPSHMTATAPVVSVTATSAISIQLPVNIPRFLSQPVIPTAWISAKIIVP